MEKFIQFFIVALIVGLVGFSSDLGIPTQRIQGSLDTSRLENNTVTGPNTNDSEADFNREQAVFLGDDNIAIIT